LTAQFRRKRVDRGLEEASQTSARRDVNVVILGDLLGVGQGIDVDVAAV